MAKDNFNFWCPVEISKATDENGEENMTLGGIASTADEDSDGEFLDPKGFDIKPLKESGVVNWHHQAKTCPATIIGEPVVAEIRKEGLYIETKLYPSSAVARDVWELAKTLEKDSKTRRLGYSIEGKVVERKSEDKSSPDYKRISKAIITGVAVTHQPKNPKTFANIIKGEIDDDIEDTEEGKEDEIKKKKKEKSLDTTTGRPLIKESVDPKLKVVTFGKSEVMEKLFQDIPGISIEKANKIYNLIQNVSIMSKRKMVTEEDISKAYDALGIEPIMKADDDTDFESDNDTEDVEEDDEEKAKSVKKAKTKKQPVVDDDDDEYVEEDFEEETEDDDTEEETEEDEEEVEETATKAQIFGRFERIEKAMATSHMYNSKYIKALGVMVKAQSQDLEKAIDSLEVANKKIAELTEINKAQTEEISTLNERLDSFGSFTPAPKSVRFAKAVERGFEKGEDAEIEKGGANTVKLSNKQQISEILDQATFAKGFDSEFSSACLQFEANGSMAPNIISRLKSEFGINVVK